jgi:CheY-like chemotaxis protein
MAIADLCRTLGVRAVISADGETAHEMLRRHRPDGVIVDVMMPDEDGYEALKEVAGYDSRLPVLLITGHGEPWLRMGATLARAHGLAEVHTCAKPVRTPALAGFIGIVTANTAHESG